MRPVSLGGSLRAVDNQDLHRASMRFDSETQLFLKSSEDGRTRRCGRRRHSAIWRGLQGFVGSPFQLDVELTG